MNIGKNIFIGTIKEPIEAGSDITHWLDIVFVERHESDELFVRIKQEEACGSRWGRAGRVLPGVEKPEIRVGDDRDPLLGDALEAEEAFRR